MHLIDRIVRMPECVTLAGVSKATIYRKMAAGTFPSNRKLGVRCAGWRLSEILAWVDAQ
ncbi:helix-turn-helix transcriptional regulator [Croceibacterium ferulae]|uniref:helix-turn-helix transcriptional regulator n=1 Tax=Croceibacterium ferulae TaxID=1854641 RepID=UPI000EAB4C06|nr:AlpA family phage regulatory protein [Croceibacterium ferulae]